MKARIRKNNFGYYFGEIYSAWYNPLFNTEWVGWKKVTSMCMTKLGAKIELKRWKDKNISDEFEL